MIGSVTSPMGLPFPNNVIPPQLLSQAPSDFAQAVKKLDRPPNAIAVFEKSLTGDLVPDQLALRTELEHVESAEDLRQLMDAFLKEPELTEAEKLSIFIQARREGGHPLFDRLDRLNAASYELNLAMSQRDEKELLVEANKIQAEIKTEIASVKEMIAQDLANELHSKLRNEIVG